MSENPYERRRDAERRPGTMMSGSALDMGWATGGGLGRPRESPLALEDIEALVESAAARSHRRHEFRHGEEVRNSRREAWAEGHRAGLDDGKRALLTAIDQRFGERVRDLLADGRVTLSECEGREVSERERNLLHRLSQAVSVAEALIHAHHDGFEEPRVGTSVSFHGTPVRGEPSG